MFDTWKRLGIDGWLQGEHPWYHLAEKLGAMAAPFLGALPDEVLIAGSTVRTCTNCTPTFFKPKASTPAIHRGGGISDRRLYRQEPSRAARAQSAKHHLVVVPSEGGTRVDERDIVAAMSDEIAIAILPVALYRTGQILDIRTLTTEAHARGVMICFDGCHSVGVMEHAFHDDGVDMGVFCTYKYLNGGPGAVGGLFVHQTHLGRAPGPSRLVIISRGQTIRRWYNDFTPAAEAGAFQIGTPNILSMAPLLGAFQLLKDAGLKRIRAKSLALTAFMIELIDSELPGLGFSVGTPRADHERGGHVALRHAEAPRICKALKKRGVIPDFRPPDIIRLSPSPYYTSFAEGSRNDGDPARHRAAQSIWNSPTQRDVVA